MFGRPIGQNQGVQFPIARAYAQMRAAELMVHEAARALRGGPRLRAPRPTWRSCSPPTRRGRPPTCACRPMAASASPRNTTSSASSARRGSTGGADLDQPDPVLSRRARARPAAVVLMACLPLVRPPRGLARAGGGGADLLRCRLADAGARVIKIERPEGDFARYYDDLARGESAYFVWLNRGKESVVLDLAPRRRQGAARRHAGARRRVRAEPQARRGRPARLCDRAAARASIRG